MNKNLVTVAATALQMTNSLLEEFQMPIITAMEIEIFLCNITDNQQINKNLEQKNLKDAIDFIESDYENINVSQLILFCYHRIHSLPEYLRQNNHDVAEINNYLYKLATAFIPAGNDVSIYAGHISDDLKRYELDIVSSEKELYNKPIQNRKLKLDDIYSILIDQINIEDMNVTVSNEKLADLMECYVKYNSRIMSGTRPNEIMRNVSLDMSPEYERKEDYEKWANRYKREIYSLPEIRANLKEHNLYAIAAYRLSKQLDLLIKDYKLNNNTDLLTLSYLMQTSYVLDLLYDNILQEEISILLNTEEGAKEINAEQLRDKWKNSLDLLGKMFIHQNPEQLYNPQVLALLKKESALKLLEKVNCKDEYYFSMYQAGLVTFSDMIEYEKNIKPEYESAYRVRAIILKLTNSISVPENVKVEPMENEDPNNVDIKKREKELAIAEIFNDENPSLLSLPRDKNEAIDILYEPENFFSYTLDDKSLYEMMNKEIFFAFAKYSFEHIKEKGKYANQAKKNIDTMVKKGDFSQEIIMSLYIYNGATLKELENLIGTKRMEEMYDADDFAEVYKKIREADLEQNLSEEEQNEMEVIQGEYRFYTELFARLGYLGNEDREVELLDYLGDLIDNKQVLKELYQNGLLSVQNLHGLNNELVGELYKENLLRDKDKKYMVFYTDNKLSTGDLIRLSNEGNINSRDVFNLYMKGKYDISTLKDFAEGINTDEIFKDDDLVNKAKRYGVVKDKDVISDFKRYVSAYVQIKGIPSNEIRTKLYKAIGGKNSKSEILIDMYNRGLINIRDIDNIKDTLLIDMIKLGTMSAEDEEFLFKDTEKDGKKYLRLTKILPYLTSDQKINILASVYGTVDEISTPRVAFLSKYLEEAVEDKKETSGRQRKIKEQKSDDETKEAKSSEKNKNLFAFGEKFNAFKEIDANYKHEVASGSYVIYFEKLNTVVLEEIYRTTSNGNDFYNTQHATYIVKGTDEVFNCLGLDRNNNLYDEFIKNLIFQNSKGVNSVDWSKLIQMYRDKIKGTSKCLHTTEERWKNNLRKKIGLTSPDKKEKIDKCLKNIEATSLDFNAENIDNADSIEH